jgi:hypothetical protein
MAKTVDTNRLPAYPTFTNENGLAWLVSPEGTSSLRLDEVADISMNPTTKILGNVYSVYVSVRGAVNGHNMGYYLTYDDAKTLVRRIQDEVTLAVQAQRGVAVLRFPNTDDGEKFAKDLAENIKPGSVVILPNTRDSYGEYEWDVKSVGPVEVVRQEEVPPSVSVNKLGDARCPSCGSNLAKNVSKNDDLYFVECTCKKTYTVSVENVSKMIGEAVGGVVPNERDENGEQVW